MRRAILLILMMYFLAPGITGQEMEFTGVEAQHGDGVIKLLERYALDHSPCHRAAFYEINKLTPNSSLFAGKKYALPVKLYQYNGKSIRSTIGEDNWEKAIRIKKYNEYLLKKGLRPSHYTEDNRLWVPLHEIDCSGEASAVAVTSRSRYISLFGEEHGHVPIVDQSLNDKVYYIVSGHGGPDPGAICTHTKNTMCEDEYAYDVSLRLARQLIQRGATVHMIIQDEDDGIRSNRYLDCDEDERCMTGSSIPLNQTERLRQRVDVINEKYHEYIQQGIEDQQVVSLHVDSRAQHHRQDVFFYHFSRSNSGLHLARSIHEKFEEEYTSHRSSGQYSGTVQSRDLYLLKYTLPTAVYVELANIQNFADQKRIVLSSNREALARWIYGGLTEDQ